MGKPTGSVRFVELLTSVFVLMALHGEVKFVVPSRTIVLPGWPETRN